MPPDFAAAPASPLAAPAPGEPAIPLLRPRPDYRAWVGGLVAIGLFAAVLVQLSRASSEAIAMVLRLSPAAWLVFVLLYLAQPVSDMVIFRRLWRLPVSGFGALLRKTVINEIVFGYSGEAYFYLWARRHAKLVNAPFNAIKDVNILSALGGNVLTLAMLGVTAEELGRLNFAAYLGPVLWSGGAVVALSLVILVFARRVFSLRRGELAFVAAAQAARLAATSGLTILLWRIALPNVAPGVWLVLLTVRLLVARLPFLANKDLVFASLVFALIGAHSPAALLLATLAVATLLAHLVILALVGGQDVLRAASGRAHGATVQAPS